MSLTAPAAVPVSAAAPVPVPVPAAVLPVTIRRFELPDLDRHGMWLMPRLRTAFPHLNDRAVIGWLRSIMHSNEFLFLYQDNSVALAQCMTAHTLAPKPIVEERFVFVRDVLDKEQLAAAALFYDNFAQWAKHQGAEVVIVEEMSDVPHDMIGKQLGRIFSRQQHFGRV